MFVNSLSSLWGKKSVLFTEIHFIFMLDIYVIKLGALLMVRSADWAHFNGFDELLLSLCFSCAGFQRGLCMLVTGSQTAKNNSRGPFKQ